jgi:hypothetical protein
MTQNKKTNFQVGDFVKVKNGKKDPDFEESGTLLTNCTNRLIRRGSDRSNILKEEKMESVASGETDLLDPIYQFN